MMLTRRAVGGDYDCLPTKACIILSIFGSRDSAVIPPAGLPTSRAPAQKLKVKLPRIAASSLFNAIFSSAAATQIYLVLDAAKVSLSGVAAARGRVSEQACGRQV
ncbi:hypothetical protein CDAR_621551 [Caerostris darwini]|uniref:Uncharacterized protein n=1 Tax=Caerostris darwini TaxID=1538125 RepID=A0AAV4P8L5_9ARAC|nr:hypothetical protein CDAR_621551 [Caerostris darwini]